MVRRGDTVPPGLSVRATAAVLHESRPPNSFATSNGMQEIAAGAHFRPFVFMHIHTPAPVSRFLSHAYVNTLVGYPHQNFKFRSSSSSLQLAAVVILATLLTGCAVPLGPGFRLRTRQMALGTAAATSAPVHLRITDRIENTGNRPLEYLDVNLPSAIDPAKNNVSIRIDGKPATPLAGSADPASPLRLRFDPPWPVRQAREFILEYDLATDPVSGGVAAVAPEGFYLADPRALPSWLTPVGFFARGDVLDRDERFEITLPADFRVVASGRQQGKRSRDGAVLYRFRTSGSELPSFVVAGRYQELIVPTANGNLLFWTFRALDPGAAQAAAERLTATVAIFTTVFGPLPRPGPLRLVEAPAGLLPDVAASFPQGLLLSPQAFEQGIASESMLRAAEAELVRIWFGWQVPLRGDTEIVLGRGLGLFAFALAAEARGGQPARRAEIARLLADYDRARVNGDEGSLQRLPEQSTPPQLTVDSLKAALFLANLDDLAGQNKFEEAIQRLQLAFPGRGLTLSIDDLRSSLETSTGSPMADVFRQWFGRPGVPEEFRERYNAAPGLPPNPRPPAVAHSRPVPSHAGGQAITLGSQLPVRRFHFVAPVSSRLRLGSAARPG